jgi:hypothetical protein
VTAADAHAELHDLVGRLTPDQAWRLRALAACSPELAEIVEQEDETVQREREPPGTSPRRRRCPSIGIWESGRGDLSERDDEIIRARMSG